MPLELIVDRVENNPDPAKNIQPYPADNSSEAQAELDELQEYFDKTNRRHFFRNTETLSPFLVEKRFIRPWPAGAVLNRRGSLAEKKPGMPILATGGELARLFESETPGLWHRHVLNVLLDPSTPNGLGMRLSPPRQALIWAALDVAIVSALSAIWHYKWLASGIARRPRPQEVRDSLGVLFDYRVAFNSNGDIRRHSNKNPDPPDSPGSPRHPAYGSGHSTYSAAASRVLGCLIPEHREDFRLLAENIGHARLWGGVHWRSDHEAGVLVGNAIGDLIMEQLNKSGIMDSPAPLLQPPPIATLQAEADAYAANCGNGTADFCKQPTTVFSIQNRSSVPAADEPQDSDEPADDQP